MAAMMITKNITALIPNTMRNVRRCRSFDGFTEQLSSQHPLMVLPSIQRFSQPGVALRNGRRFEVVEGLKNRSLRILNLRKQVNPAKSLPPTDASHRQPA